MSKYDRGHRVYIVENRGQQKIGVATSIFAIENKYHIAPWPVRVFQLLLAKTAHYCWRALFAIQNLLSIIERLLNRLTQRLTWLAMRTPSTIKYLSNPMDYKTAETIEKAMHKKLDSAYGKEKYSLGWCEINKFDIGQLKRWAVDSTLEK